MGNKTGNSKNFFVLSSSVSIEYPTTLAKVKEQLKLKEDGIVGAGNKIYKVEQDKKNNSILIYHIYDKIITNEVGAFLRKEKVEKLIATLPGE